VLATEVDGILLEAVVEVIGVGDSVVGACEGGGDVIAGCAVLDDFRVDEDREAQKAEYAWTPATVAPKRSMPL